VIERSLGHYHILDKLGAGGMGEVYRARDTRLNRDVALKVLLEAFASDAQRMARFEREAQVLASLNHPNIAAIYGLEESEGVRAIVMEYVPGEVLKGPLPVNDALPLARQIAEALEYAHDRGVIHRDLKPANVKVTPEGNVKVLDFGLAKALDDDRAATASQNSPTLSLAATRAGVILGTAAYMSPEQAKAKPVDRRADIWAFGVVLAEMLTGRQLYGGENAPETLAFVMLKDPQLEGLPADTPAAIRQLLRRCLEKDPRRRLRDIGEARIVLEAPLEAPALPVEPAPGRAEARRGLKAAPLLAATALLASLAIWGWLRTPRPTPRFVARWTSSIQSPAFYPAVTLSSDGSRLAYAGSARGVNQVHVRLLEQLEAKPFSGTDGAQFLFFSPDGQWIGYIAQAKLKKVPVTGGASITLCDAGPPFGASWGPDDTIIFATGLAAGLKRVPAAGGAPKDLATPDSKKGESGFLWPQFLPGGRAVLFTILTGGSADEARVAVLNLRSGERKVLVEGGSNARYVPTGHVVYGRAGALFAVPFDAGRLQVMGNPVPILEGVSWASSVGFADFSFSDAGTLVYVPGGASESRTLVWVDRKGTATPAPAPGRGYLRPALSPDGTRVALEIRDSAKQDIWIYELTRGTLTRLTFEFENSNPIWTPNGKRVTYRSQRPDKGGLYWAPADGSGPPEPLLALQGRVRPGAWTPDGKTLAFEQGTSGSENIWMLPAAGDPPAERKPRPVLQAPYREWEPQLSPDGRWLAYTSNESARNEVYVQPFPGPGGKWQISTDGGIQPRWARSGRELYYRNGDRMMSVDIATSPSFRAGTPQVLFEGHYESAYAVALDSRRFLMLKGSGEQSAAGQVQVVMEWFEELKRRVPAGGER